MVVNWFQHQSGGVEAKGLYNRISDVTTACLQRNEINRENNDCSILI